MPAGWHSPFHVIMKRKRKKVEISKDNDLTELHLRKDKKNNNWNI